MSMVHCQLRMSFTDDQYELTFEKEYSLPFMPRRDDKLKVSGCGDFRVTLATYDVEKSVAYVWLNSWERFEEWPAMKKWLESEGWSLVDCGDDIPKCFDETPG